MTSLQKKRNLWLDLFKIFLAYMVICIHFTGKYYWFFPIYSLSVPTFFMISGYFCYHKDQGSRLSKAVVFFKRSTSYMIIGFSIYIVYDFIMCYVNGNGVGYYFTTLFYDNLFDFFFLNRPITYSGYQLWFLIALFVLSIIHYFAVKYKKEHYYRILIPVCYIIYLFFSGYMRLFQETDMPIRYTRNALFFGLPNFALGYTLAQLDLHKRSWYKYVYLALGLLFAAIQIPESSIVEMEMFASTIPAVTFLFLFFLGLPSVRCDWYYSWIGKSLPYYIYILHPAVGITLDKFHTFSSPILRTLVIFIISVVIYEVVFLISKFIKKKPETIKEG